MEIPAGYAAQQAITQQNVALSVLKKSAQADQQLANILAESAQNTASGSRGGNLNILV